MIAAPVQRNLALPISADVALVSLSTVSAMTGWHIDRVAEAAQEWPWVFDFGTGQRIVSELRVWKACVTGSNPIPDRPGRTDEEELAEVIAEVIGTDKGDVRGGYLETRWSISNQTLKRLTKAGEFAHRVQGHTLWIERASLAAFLARRYR